MGNDRLTICQISDIHCGNAYFIPELLDRTIIEINRANPTVVVVAGDLTDAGYREEFAQAAEYIARIECENVMVIPGNHDSRNVGYIHFERLFGERQSLMGLDDVVLVGVDSSEPDLNDGQVGREHYGFIEEAFSDARDKLKVFVVHHHLIPLPGTGRERNIIFDAGDVLERLVEARVDLVLGAQARTVLLEVGGHADRERGDRLDPPPQGQHPALLQRDRGRGRAGGGLSQVPVQGARARGALRLKDQGVLPLRGEDRR